MGTEPWRRGAASLREQGLTNGHFLVVARPAIFCLNCGYYGSRALIRNLHEQCNPARPAARYNRILSDLEACYKPFTRVPLGPWTAPTAAMVKDLLHTGSEADAEPADNDDNDDHRGRAVPTAAELVSQLEQAACFRAADVRHETAQVRPVADPIFDNDGRRVLPPLPELPPARSLRRLRFRF